MERAANGDAFTYITSSQTRRSITTESNDPSFPTSSRDIVSSTPQAPALASSRLSIRSQLHQLDRNPSLSNIHTYQLRQNINDRTAHCELSDRQSGQFPDRATSKNARQRGGRFCGVRGSFGPMVVDRDVSVTVDRVSTIRRSHTAYFTVAIKCSSYSSTSQTPPLLFWYLPGPLSSTCSSDCTMRCSAAIVTINIVPVLCTDMLKTSNGDAVPPSDTFVWLAMVHDVDKAGRDTWRCRAEQMAISKKSAVCGTRDLCSASIRAVRYCELHP